MRRIQLAQLEKEANKNKNAYTNIFDIKYDICYYNSIIGIALNMNICNIPVSTMNFGQTSICLFVYVIHIDSEHKYATTVIVRVQWRRAVVGFIALQRLDSQRFGHRSKKKKQKTNRRATQCILTMEQRPTHA